MADAASPSRRMAHLARVHGNATAKYQAEGRCRVCGLVVPVWITEKRMRAAQHWPDDPAFSYDENPTYFCRGSSEDPSALLEWEPVARTRVSPETMALLMDGAADEIEGRVTVFAVRWDDRLSRQDAHRLSRSWAENIAERQAVALLRFRAYGERRLELVA